MGGPSRHGRRGRKRKEQQQRKVEDRRKRQSGQEQRRILDQNRIEYARRMDWRYLKKTKPGEVLIRIIKEVPLYLLNVIIVFSYLQDKIEMVIEKKSCNFKWLYILHTVAVCGMLHTLLAIAISFSLAQSNHVASAVLLI